MIMTYLFVRNNQELRAVFWQRSTNRLIYIEYLIINIIAHLTSYTYIMNLTEIKL